MRIFWSTVVLFLFLSGMTLLSEPKGNPPDQGALKIKFKMGFPATIVHVYKMNDTTIVKRKYSDSSVKSYKREYDYFLTERAPSQPEKGFLKVDVSVDSLFYKFTEADAVFEFNSQADNPGAITFEDLVVTSVPLGKDFTMTYSPYGEMVSVEGEKLDWLKNYVEENGKGLKDSTKAFITLDGISLNRLKYIAEPKKLIYPINPVKIKEEWSSPLDFQINGLNYFDTVKAKVVMVADGEIHIEAKLNNIRVKNDYGKFYAIKGQLLKVQSCKGIGELKLVVSNKGTIKKAELITFIDISVNVHKDVFTEQISSKVSWDLLKQLTFK